MTSQVMAPTSSVRKWLTKTIEQLLTKLLFLSPTSKCLLLVYCIMPYIPTAALLVLSALLASSLLSKVSAAVDPTIVAAVMHLCWSTID